MESDKFTGWLTLGANLGVLIGLGLLIFEIRQNSDLVRVQIEQTRSESYVDWLRLTADSEHIPSLYAKMDALAGNFEERYRQLDPEERVRFQSVTEARYYDYENLYAQYSDGFFSEEYWQERIAPAIREWAPRWYITNPPDGPKGRKAFKDEVARILLEQQR